MNKEENFEWVDYDGQPLVDYEFLGTDTIKYPITEDMNVEEQLKEIVRRCGKAAPIRLYRKVGEELAG